ncbi:MAG: glyoxylate/hydroxypyruvate reductase A [Pseudomonadota bacterium]
MRVLLPEMDVRDWWASGDPADIEVAIVWKPPAGGLRQFPNLRCIVSIGAGIDHVLADSQLPTHVPIIRTTSTALTERMREYVVLHVLRIHRSLAAIEAAQKTREWLQVISPPASERRVGIMGLGNLGADCALALKAVGFDVAGWSRTAKEFDGIRCFCGDSARAAFLETTEILVNLLPLTPETEGILSAELFHQLPTGAAVINCARGQHLVEADLLDALDRGRISAATLDVFHTEPLPPDHPFWDHPDVLVTPHVASLVDPVAGGKTIAANLRAFLAGETVADLADRSQGY